MSEESIKRSTKGHQKSEREQNGSKAKKGRKPGTAKSHGLCEGLQRSAPSITEPESTADSTLARRAENQPSNTPPDTLSKMKMSKKRKQRDCGAILDESVDAETDATELEPPKNKKRDEYREEDRVILLSTNRSQSSLAEPCRMPMDDVGGSRPGSSTKPDRTGCYATSGWSRLYPRVTSRS